MFLALFRSDITFASQMNYKTIVTSISTFVLKVKKIKDSSKPDIVVELWHFEFVKIRTFRLHLFSALDSTSKMKV